MIKHEQIESIFLKNNKDKTRQDKTRQDEKNIQYHQNNYLSKHFCIYLIYH